MVLSFLVFKCCGCDTGVWFGAAHGWPAGARETTDVWQGVRVRSSRERGGCCGFDVLRLPPETLQRFSGGQGSGEWLWCG